MKATTINNAYFNGEVVRYTGKGFLGFDKSRPYALFVRYDNESLMPSAVVKHNGFEVLVYLNEIEKI